MPLASWESDLYWKRFDAILGSANPQSGDCGYGIMGY